LLYGLEDIKTVEYLISQKLDPNTGSPLEDEQRIALHQLRRVIDYAEATDCRRTVQLSYFGEVFTGNCNACDNCCHPKPIADWTVEAQMLLSCVARFAQRGQQFGLNYTIDVLRGSKSKRILDYGHDQLSTYGIGQSRSLDEWRRLGRSLVHQQLVDETVDGYPVLELNALSWEILRNQRTVMLAIELKPQDPLPQASDTADDDEVEALFARLQKLRKRLADEQFLPPYIVFSNASLREMARRQPVTLEQFAQISGVGDRKLAQYGDVFLAEICAFQEE
jgi:ATP-dependent DNA helicase RecQ